MQDTVHYIELPLGPSAESQKQSKGRTSNTCASIHNFGLEISGYSFMFVSPAPFGFVSLFTFVCLAATLCSTVLSLILFARSTAVLSSKTIRPGLSDSGLRRPSQYIGLDKIKPAHDFPPIINFPEIVLQVHLNDSRRIMKEDHRMLRTNTGTVYSDDRHIHVTDWVRLLFLLFATALLTSVEQVSSIIQFRHLDYAMERCSLNAVIPEYVENGSSNGNMIDIWLLDTSVEISRQLSHSWASAPKRRRRLTSLTLTSSSAVSYDFHCPSNEFTTLELSCPSFPNRPCHVDFWQDRRRVPIGGSLHF